MAHQYKAGKITPVLFELGMLEGLSSSDSQHPDADHDSHMDQGLDCRKLRYSLPSTSSDDRGPRTRSWIRDTRSASMSQLLHALADDAAVPRSCHVRAHSKPTTDNSVISSRLPAAEPSTLLLPSNKSRTSAIAEIARLQPHTTDPVAIHEPEVCAKSLNACSAMLYLARDARLLRWPTDPVNLAAKYRPHYPRAVCKSSEDQTAKSRGIHDAEPSTKSSAGKFPSGRGDIDSTSARVHREHPVDRNNMSFLAHAPQPYPASMDPVTITQYNSPKAPTRLLGTRSAATSSGVYNIQSAQSPMACKSETDGNYNSRPSRIKSGDSVSLSKQVVTSPTGNPLRSPTVKKLARPTMFSFKLESEVHCTRTERPTPTSLHRTIAQSSDNLNFIHLEPDSGMKEEPQALQAKSNDLTAHPKQNLCSLMPWSSTSATKGTLSTTLGTERDSVGCHLEKEV